MIFIPVKKCHVRYCGIAQKFSSGTGSPGLSWKEGRKTVVVILQMIIIGQMLATGWERDVVRI